MTTNIPKRIFIVPYRNRIEQKFFFSNQMTFILEGQDDYEIYFSHQCDARPFNRGATKNIGFMAMREKYPNDYKNITFIFNDVDTLPFHKIFDYQTTKGRVKHYYGFNYALGGIVVIKGCDFEILNGYPNFWSWGNEDSVFQTRCEKNNIIVDRDQFYPIGSPEILQLFDGVKRLITPKDYYLGQDDTGEDGIKNIRRLTLSTDKESLNPKDNKYVVANQRIGVINILSFLTTVRFEQNEYYDYDLRESTKKIIHPEVPRISSKNYVEDWTNIELNLKNQPEIKLIKQQQFQERNTPRTPQKPIQPQPLFTQRRPNIQNQLAQKQYMQIHPSEKQQFYKQFTQQIMKI